MVGNLNILIAFAAGLASFLSPCVLPLVPSYLAQLVGPGVAETMIAQTTGGASAVTMEPLALRRTPLWHALAFVGGFSMAFIALGASASVLGEFLRMHQLAISRIGGLVLIAMGLHFAGVFNIPVLYREKRIQWRPVQQSYSASFVIGLIFAIGWTPCVGVILTTILLLAAQSNTLASGVVLLAAYSLGLGIPFIAMGAAFAQARPLLRRMAPYVGIIERVTGFAIVLMGFIIFNGWLLYLNRYFAFGVR